MILRLILATVLAWPLLAAWPNGYTYRRTITIDYTKVGGTANLTDFPVLVSGTYTYLKTTANGGNVQHASGYDIRFESTAGTQLKHEVESWSATTGVTVMWVKVPSVSYTANTEIYLYYGNASVSAAEEDPPNVWDANYKSVWHLPDGSTLTAADSTSNANTGTLGNTPTAAAGKMGGGASFAAASSEYIYGANTVNTSPATVSVWVYMTGAPAAAVQVGGFGEGDTSYNAEKTLWIESDGKLYFYVYSDAPSTTSAPASAIPFNEWVYLAGSVGAAGMKAYVNGVEVGSAAPTSSYASYSADNIILAGSSRGVLTYPDQVADEFRISSTQRTGGWILTEYNSQNAPATFYAVGDETEASAASPRRKSMVVFQ